MTTPPPPPTAAASHTHAHTTPPRRRHLPTSYKVLATTSVVAGFLTIPLCFDLDTALWFNEVYVTADIPESKDLEVRC